MLLCFPLFLFMLLGFPPAGEPGQYQPVLRHHHHVPFLLLPVMLLTEGVKFSPAFSRGTGQPKKKRKKEKKKKNRQKENSGQALYQSTLTKSTHPRSLIPLENSLRVLP